MQEHITPKEMNGGECESNNHSFNVVSFDYFKFLNRTLNMSVSGLQKHTTSNAWI